MMPINTKTPKIMKPLTNAIELLDASPGSPMYTRVGSEGSYRTSSTSSDSSERISCTEPSDALSHSGCPQRMPRAQTHRCRTRAIHWQQTHNGTTTYRIHRYRNSNSNTAHRLVHFAICVLYRRLPKDLRIARRSIAEENCSLHIPITHK